MNHTGMVEIEYANIKIPTLMAKAIDDYLETDHAVKNGITSRADLVMSLLRKFFDEYETKTGKFVSRKAVRQTNGNDAPQPIE